VPRRISRRAFLRASAATAVAGAAYAAGLKAPSSPAADSAQARRVITRELRFGPDELKRGTLAGVAGDPGGLRLSPDRYAGQYLSPALESDMPFHFAGIYWSGSRPEASEPSFWLRTSLDGINWADWQPAQVELPPGPSAEYDSYGSLIGADGHRYVQFIGEISGGADASILQRVGLTLLNPYDGPVLDMAAATEGQAQGAGWQTASSPASLAPGKPLTYSRESWGCDESLRYSGGQEIWPRSYVPVKTLVVHHTVTPNGYASIEEAMAHIRSIYVYHTVSQGWGDIGYNCIIDRFGNSYEGRRGRDGPGYDGPYGREFLSQDVVAGHALVYNHGSSGIALLGTFCTPGECAGQAPSSAAISRLQEVLAFECERHGLHPQRASNMLLRDGSWHYGLPNVVGHRDVGETSCPGGHVYGRLPDIRAQVAARLTDSAAPVVGIASAPPETTVHDNKVQFSWVATGAGPLEFSHYLEGWRYEGDGSVTYIHGFTPDRQPAWSPWSTRGSAEFALAVPGLYTFHIAAKDAAGRIGYQDTRSFVGEPHGVSDGVLLQGSGPGVYIMQGGLKRHIPNAATFVARGYHWGSVNHVSDGLVYSIPLGRPLLDVLGDGNLVKGSGPAVYVMEGGAKSHVASAGVMDNCGYSWDAIYSLPDSIVGPVPQGQMVYGPPCPHLSPPDGALIKSSGPAVYITQRGLKRQVPNALTFEANALLWGNVDTIADSSLRGVPTGHPVLNVWADGNLLKGSGPAVYVMQGGQKRHVVSSAVLVDCGYGWDEVRSVSDSLLGAIPTGAPLSGPPCPLLIPPQGSLIRGSGPAVYVMEGSTRRHVSSADFEGCHYEWGDVSVIADSALARIPSGPSLSGSSCPAVHLPQGSLIKGSGPAVYVIDQSQKRHIASAEVFQSCHYDWRNVTVISDKTLAGIPLGSPLTGPPCP